MILCFRKRKSFKKINKEEIRKNWKRRNHKGGSNKNYRLDYEAKRLRFIERTREEHVVLAIELEKVLNAEKKVIKI